MFAKMLVFLGRQLHWKALLQGGSLCMINLCRCCNMARTLAATRETGSFFLDLSPPLCEALVLVISEVQGNLVRYVGLMAAASIAVWNP